MYGSPNFLYCSSAHHVHIHGHVPPAQYLRLLNIDLLSRVPVQLLVLTHLPSNHLLLKIDFSLDIE